ncbi:NAD+ synthase [Candidatus Parvarchaeota archaeon]|nr:NAD+ synthase [Candidatus Parvarchaeota archaeon]
MTKFAVTLDKPLTFSVLSCASQIVSNLRAYSKKTGVSRCVLGLSGGVDSAACLAICAQAFGPKNVLALLMPSKFTPKLDVSDALLLAKKFKVKIKAIDLQPALDLLYNSSRLKKERVAYGNMLARLRMGVLYAHANLSGALVIGTGDKSEITLGYFTKWGDGACDVLPIGSLYKTQVRLLALALGIPRQIAFKPSSPRLWAGHKAQKELGLGYDKIDQILHLLEKKKKGQAERLFGKKAVSVINKRIDSSRHKRSLAQAL